MILCMFQVKGKCKEPATDQWRKTVQEVLTDVMLEMEELGPSEALVYIFEQEFSFFPVSEQFNFVTAIWYASWIAIK